MTAPDVVSKTFNTNGERSAETRFVEKFPQMCVCCPELHNRPV